MYRCERKSEGGGNIVDQLLALRDICSLGLQTDNLMWLTFKRQSLHQTDMEGDGNRRFDECDTELLTPSKKYQIVQSCDRLSRIPNNLIIGGVFDAKRGGSSDP